jgi:chaperonin GroES
MLPQLAHVAFWLPWASAVAKWPLADACRAAARPIPSACHLVFSTPRSTAPACRALLRPLQMAPLGDRLLVKPREAEQVTSGGILLAGSAKQALADALVGTVVAVGDDVDLDVKKGDAVLFSKYSSSDVAVADGEVCFVAQRSILAKLS